MSTPEPPQGPRRPALDTRRRPAGGPDQPPYVPVSPLLPDDPPRVGGFWLDARLSATPAGIAFTAHDEQNKPVMLLLLSEGAAADAAARARFAGEINALHIDTVLARGGQGQDTGRLGRKFRSDENDPATPTRGRPRRGPRWPTTAPPPPRRGRPDPRLGAAGHAAAPGDAVRARTTSSTGSSAYARGWPGCGRCPGRAASTGPAGGPSWSPGC